MENLTKAIFMSFAIFSLVLGLSFGMYLLSELGTASKSILSNVDKTKNYQSVEYDTAGDEDISVNISKKRIVGVDTVVSSLYRYYKENFSVEIYSSATSSQAAQLYHVFDVAIESAVEAGTSSRKC